MDNMISQIIIRAIVTILMITTTQIIIFITYLRSDDKYTEGKIIRFPKVCFWVCFIVSILSGTIIITKIIDKQGIWEFVLGLLISLPFFIFTIVTVNWKIVLFKDTFIYRTAFRRTYTFRYKDVERYIRKKDIVFLKVQKKWLIIDSELPDIDCFLNRIRIKPRK